jgi:hypothetical protein
VEWHYLISTDDLDRAKEFLVMDAPRHTILSSDEEVIDSSLELLEAGAPSIPEPRRPDTYLDRWYPEDATVEVWSQDGNDLSSMIQRSLDANRIQLPLRFREARREENLCPTR